MSRIDEALRRAAEQGGHGPEQIPRPHPSSTQDVAVLEGEPYPEEARAAHRVAALPPGPAHRPAHRPAPHDGAARRTPEPSPSASPPGPKRSAHAQGAENSVIERIDRTLAEKTVTDANMSGVAREQYRRVAAMLHDAQGTTGLKVVMIASAVPGEGKTLTASNLALTLSESYHRRVLLIDADLRKPTLHQVFQISSVVGLTTGLDPARPPKLTVHQMTPRLSVLPAGRPTSDPMAGLTSERMRKLLDEAKETFDWVIIDTPPMLLLPDAHLLASMVDAAVLVIRAHSTAHDAVRRTADAIGRQRILGVVLNQADPETGGTNHDSYYGYYGRTPADVRSLSRT